MQRRLNSETGVNNPFENVPCQGRIQKFFEGRGINFRHFFQAQFFSAELTLSILCAKNDSRGIRGHAPPENLFTAMAILMLFEQCLRKVWHIFGY